MPALASRDLSKRLHAAMVEARGERANAGPASPWSPDWNPLDTGNLLEPSLATAYGSLIARYSDILVEGLIDRTTGAAAPDQVRKAASEFVALVTEFIVARNRASGRAPTYGMVLDWLDTERAARRARTPRAGDGDMSGLLLAAACREAIKESYPTDLVRRLRATLTSFTVTPHAIIPTVRVARGAIAALGPRRAPWLARVANRRLTRSLLAREAATVIAMAQGPGKAAGALTSLPDVHGLVMNTVRGDGSPA